MWGRLFLYRGLGRGVYTLALARMVNRFGDFVQLLLVLILTLKVGLAPAQVGIVTSISYFTTLLGQVGGGYAGDKVARKVLLPICQVFMALIYIACAFCYHGDDFTAVIILILVSGIFRGSTAPLSNAMIADLSSAEKRPAAFSLLYVATNIGVAVGPLVAASLFSVSMELLFSLSAVSLVAAACLVIFLVPYIGPVTIKQSFSTGEGKPLSWFFCLPMIIYCLISIVYAYLYTQTTFILPLQCNDSFGPILGPQRYSLIATVNAVSVLVFTMLISAMSAHRRAISNMVISLLLYVVGFLCFAVSGSHYSLLLISMVIWTWGEILMATNQNVLINQLSPPALRGQYNGIALSAMGIGSMLSPLVAGYLLPLLGYVAMWLMLALLGLFVALSYYLLGRVSKI